MRDVSVVGLLAARTMERAVVRGREAGDSALRTQDILAYRRQPMTVVSAASLSGLVFLFRPAASWSFSIGLILERVVLQHLFDLFSIEGLQQKITGSAIKGLNQVV